MCVLNALVLILENFLAQAPKLEHGPSGASPQPDDHRETHKPDALS
jgi:hypothetical protein